MRGLAAFETVLFHKLFDSFVENAVHTGQCLSALRCRRITALDRRFRDSLAQLFGWVVGIVTVRFLCSVHPHNRHFRAPCNGESALQKRR